MEPNEAEIDERDWLVATRRVRVPRDEVSLTFARSGGPGGQNVNKLNTKATLRWRPEANQTLPPDVRARFIAKFASRLTNDGELLIISQEHRSQRQNIEACYQRLIAMLQAVATAPRVRRATKPTKGSQMRRLEDKRRDSQKKQHRRDIRE